MIFAIAMAAAVVLSRPTASGLAADTTVAAATSEDRWFIFLGGPSGNPVWAVSHGRRVHGLDLPCFHAVPSMEPIVEATLGVQSIVIPADIAAASSLAPSGFPLKGDPIGQSDMIEDVDAEKLCSLLLRDVSMHSSETDGLILELLPPLSAMFGEGYLCKYSTGRHSGKPAVLSVSRRSTDTKSRLCNLTRQLVGIAGRLGQTAARMRNEKIRELSEESTPDESEGKIITPDDDVISMSDIAEIEVLWRESILKPYVEHLALVQPLRVHVWESMSTIEIDFPEEVDFAAWAEVIAGALLGEKQEYAPFSQEFLPDSSQAIGNLP